ncbi:RluA family pseudouridine synthase [Secundilactobacillus muriivasis]
MIQWQLTATLPADFTAKPLRQLLTQDWWLPKHLVFSLKRGQRVLVNGSYRPVNFDVIAGDQLQLTFVPEDFDHPFSNVDPDSAATVAVLYETADLLVVNKTPGSKTHPNQPGEVGTTLNHVAAYLQPKGQQPYILNRLDQETSGALLIAKNPAVVPPLVRAIKEKQVQRTYLTWVHGRFNSDHGTIALPIGRDLEDQRKRRVDGEHAQSAITHYQVIQRTEAATLVAIRLQTGRTHQIRVHLSSLGHPIVGDPLYAHDARQQRLLLHSWQLKLPLPFSFEEVRLVAPVPDSFRAFEGGLAQTPII